jgi:Ca-activated chloride channel family protein
VSFLESPSSLWGLLVLPLVWLLFRYTGYRRHSRLARFVHPSQWPRLMSTIWVPARRWKRRLAFVALILAVLALAGPQYGTELIEVERMGADLVVALDISGSMMAEDFRPTRLEEAKRAVQSLLAGLKGDRVGLVAFSGAAAIMCPLTSDYNAVKLFLELAKPGYVPQPGTNIGDALELSGRLLEGSADRDRAVILITDGEDHAGNVEGPLAALADLGARVYAVGIGSSEGTLIPEYNEQGAVRGYKKDREGNLVQTFLDATLLQQITETTDGQFFPVDPSGRSIEDILVQIGALQKGAYAERSLYRHKNRYAWPLGLALLALFAGTSLWERRGDRSI